MSLETLLKKQLIYLFCALSSGLAFGQAATIAPGTALTIFEGQKTVVVQTAKGPVEISRIMTPCGKNGGPIQALSDRDALVVDMRDTNDRVKGTIPGSLGIPYTEVLSVCLSWVA